MASVREEEEEEETKETNPGKDGKGKKLGPLYHRGQTGMDEGMDGQGWEKFHKSHTGSARLFQLNLLLTS